MTCFSAILFPFFLSATKMTICFLLHLYPIFIFHLTPSTSPICSLSTASQLLCGFAISSPTSALNIPSGLLCFVSSDLKTTAMKRWKVGGWFWPCTWTLLFLYKPALEWLPKPAWISWESAICCSVNYSKSGRSPHPAAEGERERESRNEGGWGLRRREGKKQQLGLCTEVES